MKRVAVYSPYYFPRYVGGGERLAQLTAAGLSALGVSTTIVTTGEASAVECYDGVPVRVVPRASKLFEDALAGTFADLRPEVVHMVGAWRLLPVARAARRAGARTGVAGLDYGQVCDNHRLLHADGRVCSGRMSAGRCFTCSLEKERTRDQWLGRAARWMPKPIATIAQKSGSRQLSWHREFMQRDRERMDTLGLLDLFVAPTEFAREQVRPFLSARTASARLMYPIAADLKAPARKETGRENLRVGFIGRCLQIKGLHVALDAMQVAATRVPVTLSVWAATNDGEEPEYWRPLKARAAALPGVTWRQEGVLDSAALTRIHEQIDVLVVPSLWPEYLGFVTLEALALGTPVILSDFASQRELLSSPESGECIRPGDAAALAEAFVRAWERKRQGGMPRTVSPAISSACYAARLMGLYGGGSDGAEARSCVQ